MKHTFTQRTLSGICRQLASGDKELAAVLELYGPPPFWSRPPGFATLLQIILEQQVSLASAAAAFARLQERLGTITPAGLLSLSDEELRACAFSRQKTAYARALARAVDSGQLDISALDRQPDEVVIERLTSIKGIGKWTADVYLMMVLHRTDRFPIGDIALVQSMKQVKNLPADTPLEQLLQLAEAWRPSRTVAAFMLWHAYLCRKSRTYK